MASYSDIQHRFANKQSGKNGSITAGCHKIAYTEMERMYNEIINA